MFVNKVINNNVVSIIENNIEKIVMGRGLGFKKKTGDQIDGSKIEKVFVIHDDSMAHKFMELVEDIPLDHMLAADKIISYAKETLGKKLSDLLYISLTDHIYAAIQRSKEGIFVKNALLWDIKRFYPDEFRIGIYGLDYINSKFNTKLPEDEAGFIALHIVNAEEEGGSFQELIEISTLMREIENIVKYEFNMEFDEDSVYYFRFLTHLKFFAKRVIEKKTYDDNIEEDLFDLIRNKYRNSYKCVNKIKDFLLKSYDYYLSDEEKMYLTIHIERVIYKN